MVRLLHLVGEVVEVRRQLSGLIADLHKAVANLRQSLVDLVAFGYVLPVEQRPGGIKCRPHPARSRAETPPPSCGRVQRSDIAVRPNIVDERFHYRPKQWWRLPFTPRPRWSRRRDLWRFGRRLQCPGTATERRGRFDRRIVGCALLYAGPTLSARVNGCSRGLQQLLRCILIRQAEHGAGGIQAGMRRKARRQHHQTCGKAVTGGNHRAARGVHRLRINRQGSHAGNFRSGRSVAATHPMIAAAKLAAPPSRHNSLIPSVSRPEPRSVRAAGC